MKQDNIILEGNELEHLFEKLKLHSESDMYPYHMPGHKRRTWGELPGEIYDIDITEIDGFDNLHQPEELLLALQQEAASMYGADESFYLVNGSTCGILAAISAAIPEGGRILMARNCHKAAYHAAYLRDLSISYLYPEMISDYGICGEISARQVESALESDSEIDAVFIVSPTYEGRISDVKAIADVVHKKGIPLIVDEAHGAHLGFAEGFGENSCRLGADLVIHSVHKTLPAMTQTALLHVNGSLINREMLRRFLRIYQSSSPSYVLMASIDNALQYVKQQGRAAFYAFRNNYAEMCKKLSECKHLSFLQDDWNCQDVGKLLISVKDCSISGKELYNILREEYYLQLEMAAETYVLAMFTVNDGAEAYERMTKALLEIDARVIPARADGEICLIEELSNESACRERRELPLRAAWDAEYEWVSLDKAVGRYVAEFINLYPPGIPVLVPGEYVTENIAQQIRRSVYGNLNVQGVQIVPLCPAEQNFAETTSQINIKVIR